MQLKHEKLWILRLGVRRYLRVLLAAVPLLDRTMAHALYWKGEPLLLSSGFVHLFDCASRTDFSKLPEPGAPFSAHGRDATWGHCRSWSIMHCGEVPAAVPTIARLGEAAAYLRSAPQRSSLARAAAMASRDVDSRLVVVLDSGEVLPMAPEIPLALGFDAQDTNWVPGHWRRPLQPDKVEVGCDILFTGDADELPVRLFWHRLRGCKDMNIYLVRLLIIDDDDFSVWPITELPDGIPDDVDEFMRRIQC